MGAISLKLTQTFKRPTNAPIAGGRMKPSVKVPSAAGPAKLPNMMSLLWLARAIKQDAEREQDGIFNEKMRALDGQGDMDNMQMKADELTKRLKELQQLRKGGE